jgi:signal transduction histidine kinase
MKDNPPPDPAESSTVLKLQQQLKSSNEVQAKFLSFLNHDLRGELNGVLLTMELLKLQLSKEPRLAESVEDLDAMRRAILDAVGVMDRFVKAERLRHGRIQPKNVVVEIPQLLAEVAAEFATAAKAKGIKVVVENGEAVRITTDRDLLKVILQNLVSNAIKFSPSGSVRLVGGRRISVIDQGPGIASERLATVFEPFAGGQLASREIGLYLCRQAADLLGAKLMVESTLGQGAAFHLEFSK